MPATRESSAPRAWILVPEDAARVAVWGLAPVERLERSLARAGCGEVERIDPGADLAGAERPTLLLRADFVYDERLIPALLEADRTVLVAADPAGEPIAVAARPSVECVDDALALLRRGSGAMPTGMRARTPSELVPAYIAALRKYEPPYLLPARPGLVREIEEHTFAASYKGATDLVTKWLWPRPAMAVVRVLANAGIQPNTVTIASWLLAILATWLFAVGWFGSGLVVAWLMTFLDTVDGKLARVTLSSSRLGDVLDHSLDLIHPPFWWLAWGYGLGWASHPATWIVVGGYFAGRLLEGLFLLLFKMETHCWRPIDTLFRTITARRNPNLLILSVGTAGGRPDLGLVMVALWTVASLGFHAVRIAQAAALRARGSAIAPWDEAPGVGLRPISGNQPEGQQSR
jgi:hypothetical protein